MDMETKRATAGTRPVHKNKTRSSRQSYIPSVGYPGRPKPENADTPTNRPGGRKRRRRFGPIRWNGQKVPHFFQGADPWDDVKLNHDDTIASAGCAISSVAMCLSYFGRSVTPADVDRHMDANHGYSQGSDGIANWDIALATKAAPGLTVKLDKSVRLYEGADEDAMYQSIQESLTRNIPVIARIKYGNSTATYNHFAVIVGRTRSGDHVINDPGLRDGDGAANPKLPNVVLETATRNGGLELVGIQTLKVETA